MLCLPQYFTCCMLGARLLCCGDVQTLDCAGKHQVLIFVHSRKETAKTARYLKEEALKEDRLAQFMKVLLPDEQAQLPR